MNEKRNTKYVNLPPRRYSFMAGLKTNLVEMERIELSILRCKRSVFPLALHPQKLVQGEGFEPTRPLLRQQGYSLSVSASHATLHNLKPLKCKELLE